MNRITFRCTCCRRVVPRNPRVKDQRYCGATKCQRVRKTKWQREKMSTDPDYRANQQQSQTIWQQRNPDYWRRYRLRNRDYCLRNRQLQRARDKASPDRRNLAKMDTLNSILNDTTTTYLLSPEPDNFVKMDALEVKIIPVSPG